jgi:hypothetical protein
MSAGGLDSRPKFLSLPIEIYSHWLPPVLHQNQVPLLSALEAGIVPALPTSRLDVFFIGYLARDDEDRIVKKLQAYRAM